MRTRCSKILPDTSNYEISEDSYQILQDMCTYEVSEDRYKIPTDMCTYEISEDSYQILPDRSKYEVSEESYDEADCSAGYVESYADIEELYPSKYLKKRILVFILD